MHREWVGIEIERYANVLQLVCTHISNVSSTCGNINSPTSPPTGLNPRQMLLVLNLNVKRNANVHVHVDSKLRYKKFYQYMYILVAIKSVSHYF